jgi:hypothetical protein
MREKQEGEKFCSNCMRNKPAEGGMFKKVSNGKRWRCADCTKRAITHMKGKK